MRPGWEQELTPEQLAKCHLLDIEVHGRMDIGGRTYIVINVDPGPITVLRWSPTARSEATTWKPFNSIDEAIDGYVRRDELGYIWR